MRGKSREGSLLESKAKAFRTLLLELGESRAAVIVEGKRDREALQRIGVVNPIFTMTHSPDEVAARVALEAEEAVVLVDFDRNGEELLERLVPALEAHNVKPNTDVRRKLRYIFGVQFFEEIDSKLEEFRKKLEESER